VIPIFDIMLKKTNVVIYNTKFFNIYLIYTINFDLIIFFFTYINFK